MNHATSPNGVDDFMSNHTIMILTKDRRVEILRACQYYSHFGLKIVILDGSNESLKNEMPNSHFIKYIHLGGGSIYERLMHGSAIIDSEFTTWITDDDLFVPCAMRYNVEYLQENSNSKCCGGEVRKFKLLKNGVATYPLAHWSRFSNPTPVDKANDRAERACKIVSRVETASFFYLTYKTEQLIKLIHLIHYIEKKSELFSKLEHGTIELFVTVFNVIDGNAALLKRPFCFRAENEGVDTAEYRAKIISGNDPKEKWNDSMQNQQIETITFYLGRIMIANGVSEYMAKMYSHIIVRCYRAQVRLGERFSPILECLNPYMFNPEYMKPTFMSEVWSEEVNNFDSEHERIRSAMKEAERMYMNIYTEHVYY